MSFNCSWLKTLCIMDSHFSGDRLDLVLARFTLSWWGRHDAGWLGLHCPGGIDSMLAGFTLSWWWGQLCAGWIHMVLVMVSTLCWLDSHYLNNRINSMLAEVELWWILQKRRVNHQRKKKGEKNEELSIIISLLLESTWATKLQF